MRPWKALLPAVALAAALALVVTATPPGVSTAADHLDAPGLMSPGGDGANDVNDLYAFTGADPDNTVLAMTTVPAAATDATFGSDVLYEIKVDTDGDFVEDISYRSHFSTPTADGAQIVRVMKATGDAAADPDAAGSLFAYGQTNGTLPVDGGGEYFAGLRSDPFFFDLAGFLATVEGVDNGAALGDGIGDDFFEDLNTLAIVLEVPDTEFDGAINVWATTTVDGVQIDRIGRPAINTVVNSTGPIVGAADGNKDAFNAGMPKDDAVFEMAVLDALDALSSLDTEGAYAPAEADALADILLPDVLPFDKDGVLPPPLNGRALADDVIDTELTIVTGGDPLDLFAGRDAAGAINTDDVGPHDDYLDVFPYLGVPNGEFTPPDLGDASAFVAGLTGGTEVPPVDADGRGVATFSSGSIDYRVVTYGVEDITQAHIHLGDEGENGPVVAFLFGFDAAGVTPDGTLAEGTLSGADLLVGTEEDLLDAMRGGYAYVNVHTIANPAGEVRGQIDPLDTGVAGARFTDEDGNVHEANIELIAAAGITKGSNPPANDEFAPARNITRGEIAAMIDRALALPDTATDFFDDDDGNIFEAHINRLAAAGITVGTGPRTYSPDDPVTRGQVAAFIDRALGLSATATDFFVDDDGNIFEGNINRLAAAGITKGSNPPVNDEFSPNAQLRRDEFASFMARALGWGA